MKIEANLQEVPTENFEMFLMSGILPFPIHVIFACLAWK